MIVKYFKKRCNWILMRFNWQAEGTISWSPILVLQLVLPFARCKVGLCLKRSYGASSSQSQNCLQLSQTAKLKKTGWKAGHRREGWDAMGIMVCTQRHYAWKVTQVIVQRTKKENLRENLKSCPLSHLRTPGQLLRTVGVIVALLVPENVRCSLPTKLTLEWWEETVWPLDKNFVSSILIPL